MKQDTFRVSASARVQITLDIAVGDSWGSDCPVDQIVRQATEAAEGMVRNAFPQQWQTRQVSIVGTPKVTMVLAKKEE